MVKDPIKDYTTNYQLSKQLHTLNHSSELGKNAPVCGVKPPSTTTGMSNRLKTSINDHSSALGGSHGMSGQSLP